MKKNKGGLVYPDFQEIELPEDATLECYGLDFGYSNHPSVCIAVYSCNGGYILQEKFYRTRMLIGDIIDGLRGVDYTTPNWFGGQFDIGMSKAFVLADILKIKIKIKTK